MAKGKHMHESRVRAHKLALRLHVYRHIRTKPVLQHPIQTVLQLMVCRRQLP